MASWWEGIQDGKTKKNEDTFQTSSIEANHTYGILLCSILIVVIIDGSGGTTIHLINNVSGIIGCVCEGGGVENALRVRVYWVCMYEESITWGHMKKVGEKGMYVYRTSSAIITRCVNQSTNQSQTSPHPSTKTTPVLPTFNTQEEGIFSTAALLKSAVWSRIPLAAALATFLQVRCLTYRDSISAHWALFRFFERTCSWISR